MLIKLYPAEQEITNPIQEVLDLLRQGGCGYQVKTLAGLRKEITVQGDRAEICRRLRDWLDRLPGRMATPASFCDLSLQREDGSSTTIEIHRSSLGFA